MEVAVGEMADVSKNEEFARKLQELYAEEAAAAGELDGDMQFAQQLQRTLQSGDPQVSEDEVRDLAHYQQATSAAPLPSPTQPNLAQRYTTQHNTTQVYNTGPLTCQRNPTSGP